MTTVPDPGLTGLIAAALVRSSPNSIDTFDDLAPHRQEAWRVRAREVALVVEQHTNRRMAEAKQWDGTRASIEEIAQWANANDDLMDDFTLEYSFTTGTDVFDVRIATCDGDEVVNPGDWIIRDTAGEFHLCRTVRAASEGEQQ